MGSLSKERKFYEIEITPEILRELQLIQLECLTELDRVCRENNIDYSIDGGTLLGASRHKGFIPWDDDIDIIMLRKDYEKLFAMNETTLDKKRFFLQEHRTDPHYRVGYPRIRCVGTVYQRAGHEHMKHQGGVFIDIFVLDNVPNNKLLRVLHRFTCFCNRKVLWSETGKRLAPSILWRMWYTVLSLIPARIAFLCNDTVAKICNKKQSELVRHNTHPYPGKLCNYGIPRNLMERFTELPFEGKPFKAVADYDRYLTMLYGDYKKLPPEEKRKPAIHLAAFRGIANESNP